MTVLRIEASDPLIFRDGRPNDGRSESRLLDFFPPSALIGATRTLLGRSGGSFNASKIPALLQVSLRGPLLASGTRLFVPAPADALALKGDDGVLHLRALRPIDLPAGARHSSIDDLRLVGLPTPENDKAKPYGEASRYWSWADMEDWLRQPGSRHGEVAQGFLDRGIRGLHSEERIHVALSPTGTAEDGKLFSTEGVRFLSRLPPETRDRIPDELSLIIDVDIQDPSLGTVSAGVRPLGGERRLARWSQADGVSWPSLPAWLREHVSREEAPVVRVVLLTPAEVMSSLQPACLNAGGAKVIAAKVDRPRTISGWNMARNLPHGEPKKTRRLAAAGSVYWVQLSGTQAERGRWVEERWMQNIGDDEQLRRDGFGLAAIGVGRIE